MHTARVPARLLLPRAAALLAALLTGCTAADTGSGTATPDPGRSTAPGTTVGPRPGPGGGGVELVRGDACGEVFFWAASESGTVAVTVSVDVVGRPAGGPSEFSFPLPHPDVTVRVLSGPGDLTEDFCTDVLLGTGPTGEQEAVAGTVLLTVDPPGEACGESDGRLRIDGLVVQDGTAFPPVDVRSASVGCAVGG